MKRTMVLSPIFVYLTLFSFLVCSGCGAAGTTSRERTTLENIRAQFPQVEEVPLEPLEAVPMPDREQPDSDTSFSQRVLRGDSVPFSGLLLSDSAAAFVASEYEAQIQRFQLTLTQQRDRDFARLTREIETYRLQLNADRERFLIIAQGQERYIANLEEVIRNQEQPNILEILSFVGIGALGILIGIVIGFFAGI